MRRNSRKKQRKPIFTPPLIKDPEMFVDRSSKLMSWDTAMLQLVDMLIAAGAEQQVTEQLKLRKEMLQAQTPIQL